MLLGKNFEPNIFKEKENRLTVCSILILTGFPLFALLTGFITINNKKKVVKFMRFNLIFLLLILTSYLYGYLIYGYHSFSTLLNVTASVLLFTNNDNFQNKKKQIDFINIYIISNLLFLIYELFSLGNTTDRFSSMFLEPSYFAIISGYLLIKIGLNQRKNIQIISLILFILFSKSIIGMIFIIYFMIINFKHLKLSVLLFFLLLTFLLSAYFIDFDPISNRLLNINSDISAAIRIFLPLLLIRGVFESEGLLGAGFGYLDDYLLIKFNTSSDFDFFLKYDFYGNVLYNTNVDNVFYFLIASMGILGILICVSIVTFSLLKKGFNYTIITLILGFSMGFLTLPIFINRFLTSKES